jgi:hypothetical protein
MQFDKQFHGGRSPVVLTGHGDEASRYSTEISALPVLSEDDATRRSTVAAAARFIVKAAAGFAACAESQFRTSCSPSCPGHLRRLSRAALPMAKRCIQAL